MALNGQILRRVGKRLWNRLLPSYSASHALAAPDTRPCFCAPRGVVPSADPARRPGHPRRRPRPRPPARTRFQPRSGCDLVRAGHPAAVGDGAARRRRWHRDRAVGRTALGAVRRRGSRAPVVHRRTGRPRPAHRRVGRGRLRAGVGAARDVGTVQRQGSRPSGPVAVGGRVRRAGRQQLAFLPGARGGRVAGGGRTGTRRR